MSGELIVNGRRQKSFILLEKNDPYWKFLCNSELLFVELRENGVWVINIGGRDVSFDSLGAALDWFDELG